VGERVSEVVAVVGAALGEFVGEDVGISPPTSKGLADAVGVAVVTGFALSTFEEESESSKGNGTVTHWPGTPRQNTGTKTGHCSEARASATVSVGHSKESTDGISSGQAKEDVTAGLCMFRLTSEETSTAA